MRKVSTNLTLNDGIKKMAKRLMTARSFGSLTALVEQLIRDEYDRRQLGKTMLDDDREQTVVEETKVRYGAKPDAAPVNSDDHVDRVDGEILKQDIAAVKKSRRRTHAPIPKGK